MVFIRKVFAGRSRNAAWFLRLVCVCVCVRVLPVNVFLVGTGQLCGFRKEGVKAKERLGERLKLKGGSTRSNDGEGGDQRRGKKEYYTAG